MSDESTTYTVITEDYNVVRKLLGLKAHRTYIVVIRTKQPRRVAGLLSGLRRYYNVISVRKGEPVIL